MSGESLDLLGFPRAENSGDSERGDRGLTLRCSMLLLPPMFDFGTRVGRNANSGGSNGADPSVAACIRILRDADALPATVG